MLIELSEFNLKIFIFLIFPIFKRIEDIPRKAYISNDNQLFKTFRYFLSYSLCFIPFLIIKLRSKNTDNENKEKNPKVEGYSTNSYKSRGQINILLKKLNRKKNMLNVLYLLILSALGWFCYYFRYFFNEKEYEYAKQSVGIFFIIFDYIVLSRIILKQKLYKHHFLFSLIIAVILLILFIRTIFYMDSEYMFKTFLFYFFLYICFGLYDIIGKRYMIIFFESPYFMMLIIGIINIIVLLIVDLFLYLLDSDIDGIIIGFQKNVTSVSKFFIFIIGIIIEWIWNIGIILTIYYFTPCHYFMSEYISEYIYYIVNAFNSNDEFYSAVNIAIFSIAFFINFFCCLVFNEVIILNFCGLDYNTKKRIQERVSKDFTESLSKEIIEIEDDFDNEEETEN